MSALRVMVSPPLYVSLLMAYVSTAGGGLLSLWSLLQRRMVDGTLRSVGEERNAAHDDRRSVGKGPEVADTNEYDGVSEKGAGSPQTAAVLEKEPPQPPKRAAVGEKEGCLGCLGVMALAAVAVGLMMRLR